MRKCVPFLAPLVCVCTVLVNLIIAVHGLQSIDVKEKAHGGSSRRVPVTGVDGAAGDPADAAAAAADDAVVISCDLADASDTNDGGGREYFRRLPERLGSANCDPVDLAKGGSASASSAYEYQWEAELDFLPTLTRTERFVAFMNYEVFVCIVNLIVTLTTSLLMVANTSSSRTPGSLSKDGNYSRLESSLLYFDAIVSSLRACWLFALYGYRPGVLYIASIVKKTVGGARSRDSGISPAASAAAAALDEGSDPVGSAAALESGWPEERGASMSSYRRRERSSSGLRRDSIAGSSRILGRGIAGLKAALESWGGDGTWAKDME